MCIILFIHLTRCLKKKTKSNKQIKTVPKKTTKSTSREKTLHCTYLNQNKLDVVQTSLFFYGNITLHVSIYFPCKNVFWKLKNNFSISHMNPKQKRYHRRKRRKKELCIQQVYRMFVFSEKITGCCGNYYPLHDWKQTFTVKQVEMKLNCH